ncbi:MAG: DUF4190 domain-containing protein [Planctomycetes bacterium]|nr:DUF4190 domain-containing protein [Planctomycetota bacterium]
MSEELNRRGASGIAITSLVLGIVTLLMFWVPILHLVPGLLAVLLGVVGLRIARRGTAGGAGLAVAGIVCAVLGMMPTALLVLAWGIGMGGGDIEFQVDGQDATAPSEDGPASVALRITRNEFFKDKEAYEIDQDTSNIDGATAFDGVERVEFDFESIPAGHVRYEGTLETTAPKHLQMTVKLENSVPFRFAVDGLREVAARENDQPISLDQPIPPGTHSIRITGTAP